MIISSSLILLLSASVLAQETPAPTPAAQPIQAQAAPPSHLPTYVALSPNLNDFGQFADGGPDSNWYVGFNNAWIVQLPAAPAGTYKRAFIGAKLGRAKTQPKPGRPWQREVIAGRIYMAVSNVPSFSPEQSFFLTETKDIPLDPDPRVYVSGSGRSEWFWAEVPTSLINFSGPNYLIVWSPTEYFVAASSSPILAADEDGDSNPEGGARAWVNRSIQGVPPRKIEGALETPIRHLHPGLAVKLVPQNSSTVSVEDCAADPMPKGTLFHFSVLAENADVAWIERSQDRLDWERVSGFLRRAPYQIALPPDAVPPHGAYFRAAASDALGNQGACEAVFVTPHAAGQ